LTTGTVIDVDETSPVLPGGRSVEVARAPDAGRRAASAGTALEERPVLRRPLSPVLAFPLVARADVEPAALVGVRVGVAVALPGAVFRRAVAGRSAVAIAITSLLDGFTRAAAGARDTGNTTLDVPASILAPRHDAKARTENFRRRPTERLTSHEQGGTTPTG